MLLAATRTVPASSLPIVVRTAIVVAIYPSPPYSVPQPIASVVPDPYSTLLPIRLPIVPRSYDYYWYNPIHVVAIVPWFFLNVPPPPRRRRLNSFSVIVVTVPMPDSEPIASDVSRPPVVPHTMTCPVTIHFVVVVAAVAVWRLSML